MTATTLVEGFIEAWNTMDLAKIIELIHDDISYHNMPMPVLIGKDKVTTYLTSAFTKFEEVDWKLLNLAAKGNIVLTERVDNFVMNGKTVSLPVMGVFEISSDRIITWRDYFDLQGYQKQIRQAQNAL